MQRTGARLGWMSRQWRQQQQRRSCGAGTTTKSQSHCHVLTGVEKRGSNGGIQVGRGTEDLAAFHARHFGAPAEALSESNQATVARLFDGIRAGSRSSLGSAITLVGSRNAQKRAVGNRLLLRLMREGGAAAATGKDKRDSFRIGITGAPGVGKSSFIEALGQRLVERADLIVDNEQQQHQLAVLTVDPSSSRTGGSILGDLARMERLARSPAVYIRQSPTAGALGGLARGVHEAVLLCEAAGFPLILIETVGVGQSEVDAVSMCDLFVVLLAPAHGDELQGVKRGIMELADLLIVTKDDGDLRAKAKHTQAEFISALKYMHRATVAATGIESAWQPKVLRSSIFSTESLDAVVDAMFEFRTKTSASGEFAARRATQTHQLLWSHVRDQLSALIVEHPSISAQAAQMERLVRTGEITPGAAADEIVRSFLVGGAAKNE